MADDDKLSELERKVTRLAGEVARLSAENDKREAELIEIKIMIEDRQQH